MREFRVRATRPLLIATAALAGLTTAAALVPTAAGAKAGASVIRDVRASVADIPLRGVTYPIDGNHPQPASM